MSDRRPEKLHDPAKALEWWRATGSRLAIVELYEAVTNPVAAVRRGVESGTNEGTEPDYEAAAIAAAWYDGYADFDDMPNEWPYQLTKDPDEQDSFRKQVKGIVDAAVGGRLLVDPPKEEER